MRISRKIISTVLIALILTIVSSNLFMLIQFFSAKRDLIKLQQEQYNNLYDENINIVIDSNKGTINEIADSYSRNIEKSLNNITNDLLKAESALETCYKEKKPTYTHSIDEIYLQNGVNYKDVETEFSYINRALDIIKTINKISEISEVYYVSESGMIIDLNTYNERDFLTNRKDRGWYKGAVNSNGLHWEYSYNDINTGIPVTTFSMPVNLEDGTIAGVVGIDTYIKDLSEDILTPYSNAIKYSFLTNKSNELIISSDENKSLEDFIGDDEKNKLLDQMNSDSSDANIYVGDSCVVGYASILDSTAKVGIVLNYDMFKNPIDKIGESFIYTNDVVQEGLNDKITKASATSAIAGIIVTIVVLIISFEVTHSIVKPIELLTSEIRIIDNKESLNKEINIKTGDEIEELANAFNIMTKKLKTYIENLKVITSERERISTELNIAREIQDSMIPCIFPPFPNNKEFEIFATIDPAKEVGGDFYDFFLIDDDHLAFVIADVSGKGVPAALFMVISKTLIKNQLQNGKSPAETFYIVNNQLCENNDANMFVTAFVGILNIKTGHLIYSNAGHNKPIICKNKDNFYSLNVNPCFILAGIKNTIYENAELTLKSDDMIYIYTDGITEAFSKDGNMFSEKRLLKCLNNVKGESIKQILYSVKDSVKIFTDGEEQSDDMTMLILKKS